MAKPSDVVDSLDEAARDTDAVSADDLVEELGRRSIGAMLAVPAALELTPVGVIPGAPTVLAVIVALVAVQILIGRDHFWLPDLLGRQTVAAKKVRKAAEKLRPAAEWADRHLGKHLSWLVAPPAPRIVSVAVLALCATVPALELVPFASSIPMGVIILFGLGLLARDGRVMALAWVCFAAAVYGIWAMWP